MPVLCWRHHTLIQALLSRGPLREDEFHSIFSHVTGKSPGTHQQLFNEYLGKINKELSYVQFELRACRNQYDGIVYYGVINAVADEQSKLGTRYTVPQIAFYKGIIEAIIQDATAHGSISNIDALNIRLENQPHSGMGSQSQGGSSIVPPAFRNFSMAQKEKSMEEFVQDKWLCLTTDGNVGLGVRSFLDLRSWFHNNEVPPCDVCNEAGVKAELCPSESCTVRIHQYCLKTKFSQRTVERVCPGCGSEWPFVVPKAEAVEQEEHDGEPSQTQQPGMPSLRKRTRRSSGVAEEEHEDEPSQTQLPAEPSLRKRATRSRGAEEEEGSGGPSQSLTEPSMRKNLRSRAVKAEGDASGPSQSQPPSQPLIRKKTRTSQPVHIDSDGSGLDQVPAVSSETRRTTRSSSRLQTAR